MSKVAISEIHAQLRDLGLEPAVVDNIKEILQLQIEKITSNAKDAAKRELTKELNVSGDIKEAFSALNKKVAEYESLGDFDTKLNDVLSKKELEFNSKIEALNLEKENIAKQYKELKKEGYTSKANQILTTSLMSNPQFQPDLNTDARYKSANQFAQVLLKMHNGKNIWRVIEKDGKTELGFYTDKDAFIKNEPIIKDGKVATIDDMYLETLKSFGAIKERDVKTEIRQISNFNVGGQSRQDENKPVTPAQKFGINLKV